MAGGFKIESAYVEVGVKDSTDAGVAAIRSRISGQTATLKIGADTSSGRSEAESFRAKIAGAVATTRVDADTGQARGIIGSFLAGIREELHLQATLRADTGPAAGVIGSFWSGVKSQLDNLHGTLRITSQAGQAEQQLGDITARARRLDGNTVRVPIVANDQASSVLTRVAQAARGAGSAASSTGPGFASMFSAIVSGALAAAGAIASIRGAIGALGGLFSGITGAMSAYGAQQDAVGSSSSRSAGTQLSNAIAIRNAQQSITDAERAKAQVFADSERSIADATRGVTDALEAQARSAQQGADQIAAAEQNVQDAIESAARAAQSSADQVAAAEQRVSQAVAQRARTYQSSAASLASAERRVADAVRSGAQAQQALTDARKSAQEQIDGYNRSLNSMAANEEAAGQQIEEARLRLQYTLANPLSTDLEKREAATAVKQAENSLADLKAQNESIRAKADAANKAGVEGDKEVVAAKERVADATRNAQDAAEAQTRAIEDAAYANSQADLQVAESKKALTRAIEDQGYQQQQSARRIEDAEKSLAKTRADVAYQAQQSDRAVSDARQALADAHAEAARREAEATEAVKRAQQALADTIAQQGAAAGGAGAAGVNKFAEAMAKLTPEGRAFVNQLIAMQPLIKSLQDTAQAAFLPGLTQMLKDSEGLFPIFRGSIKDIGTIMGDTARQMGELFKSEEFKANLGELLDGVLPIVQSLGDLFVSMVGGAVEFGARATPVFSGIASLIDGVRRGLEGFFAALSTPGSMDAFKSIFESLGKILETLLPILGQLAVWLAEKIAPALAGFANWFASNQDTIGQWVPIIGGLVLALTGLSVLAKIVGWGRGIAAMFSGIGGAARTAKDDVDGFNRTNGGDGGGSGGGDGDGSGTSGDGSRNGADDGNGARKGGADDIDPKTGKPRKATRRSRLKAKAKGGLAGAAGLAGGLFAGDEEESGAEKASGLFGAASQGLGGAGGGGPNAGDTLDTASMVLGQDYAGLMEKVKRDWALFPEQASVAKARIQTIMGGLGTMLSGAWAGISSTATTAWTAVTTFFSTTWTTITTGATAAWTAFTAWLGGLWAGIVAGATPAWTGFTAFLAGVWTNITVGATAAWTGFLTFLTGIWTAVTTTATTAWTGFTAFLAETWAAVTAGVSAAWDAIQAYFAAAWSTIVSVATAAWTGFTSFLSGTWAAISSAATAAWGAFTSWLAGVWANIVAGATAVWNSFTAFLAGVWNTIRNTATGAWNAFTSFLASIWNTVKTTAVNAWNGLVDYVGQVPSRIMGVLGNLGNLLVGSGRALVDGFLRGIQGAWNGLVGWVQGGMAQLRGLWPFSPAKTGPFSGTGYVTYSGAAITGDFAESIARGMPGVIESARTLMASVRGELGTGTAFDGIEARLAAARARLPQSGAARSVLDIADARIAALRAGQPGTDATGQPTTGPAASGPHIENLTLQLQAVVDLSNPNALNQSAKAFVSQMRQAIRAQEGQYS